MWKYMAHVMLMLVALAGAPNVEAQPAPLDVPDSLKVPAQNVSLFKAHATGVQIYVCAAKPDDPSSFAWTFKAPEAGLRNDDGELIGRHFAGPSWQGNDGSTVIGEAIESMLAPDANAIPWLLLRAKSHDGAGAFSSVTYVQRLETVGGTAPIDGCDKSTADTERRVDYTATYAFYYSAAQER